MGGLGLGGFGLLAGRAAGQDQRGVQAGAAGAGDVDVEAVADAERAAVAEAVAGGVVHRRLGLADDVRGRAAGRDLDRGEHGAGAGPRAVGHREVGVAGGADQLRAAHDGLGGDA